LHTAYGAAKFMDETSMRRDAGSSKLPSEQLPSSTRLGQRNRALSATAAVLLVSDPTLGGEGWRDSLVIRAVFAAMVCVAVVFRTETGWRRYLVRVCATIVLPIAFGLVCAVTGKTNSLYFFILPGLALGYAVSAPESPWHTLVVGLLSMLAGVSLTIADGWSAWHILQWLLVAAPAVALATYGAHAYRKLSRAEHRAQQEALSAADARAAAERKAVASQLAAGIAHEVNNPLAIVKGNIAFIIEEARGLGPELADALSDTVAGADRIARIVAELQSFVDGALAASSRPCRAWEMLDAALRQVRPAMPPEATLELVVPEGLPELSASPEHFQRVLTVLLHNATDAVKARPGAGRIRVEVAAGTGFLVWTVDDDGPGFSADIEKHLFEPYQTTKANQGARGLGLVLAREYLRQMGGSIEAARAPGGGARLTVRIPVASS
jgi:signal transduction histidine kinase